MRHRDSEGITRADEAPLHIAREDDTDRTLCGLTISTSETVSCGKPGSKSVGCLRCQRSWSKSTGLPYPQPRSIFGI